MQPPLNSTPRLYFRRNQNSQSPRFPVFLSGNFALRNSSGKHMKLPGWNAHFSLDFGMLGTLPYSSSTVILSSIRPCSFPPERWSPARSRLLKSVWPEIFLEKKSPKKINWGLWMEFDSTALFSFSLATKPLIVKSFVFLCHPFCFVSAWEDMGT